MYNGSILGMPRRINDKMEEREIIRKGLSSERTCGAPCLVLVIDDNLYGLMVALSYI